MTSCVTEIQHALRICTGKLEKKHVSGISDVFCQRENPPTHPGANPGIIWAYRFIALQKLSAEGTEFIVWGAL